MAKLFTIKNRLTGTVLFEGHFDTMRHCVEVALDSGANLSRADLAGANLFGADLSGANLSGAHLSVAYVNHSITATGRPARIAQRTDGFTFYLWPTSAGWRVVAGCRFFTLDEAWLHWEQTRAGTDLGDETLDILTMFELHVERSA